MGDEFKELEKQFLVDSDLEHEDIKQLIKTAIDYCQIDKNGFVVFTEKAKTFKTADRIFLVLMARYLGVKLYQKLGKDPIFSDVVGADELAKITSEKKDVIYARIKDLKDANKITVPGPATYQVVPHTIKGFLKSQGGD